MSLVRHYPATLQGLDQLGVIRLC
ncbi:hypothetical protein CGCA056_v005142 [Colletotrichum aenigma]|nr:hypothetical protein CGCA056_v005142 [Colletotrichum aenigma]